jgi:hypothetical protein
MPQVIQALPELLGDHHRIGPLLQTLQKEVTGSEFSHLTKGLVRCTFLIEADVGGASTRMDARWGLRLPTGDPRRADYDTCLQIFEELLADLVASLPDRERTAMWRAFVDNTLIPYEVPIDYANIKARPIHVPGNVVWLWGRDEIKKTMELRKAITDVSTLGEAAADLRLILSNKIKVKTYLTDRALTGAFKTNREKRWECHPDSPQFATRAECLLIERKLILQLVNMQGFPMPARETLEKAGLLDDDTLTRCPITLEPLHYTDIVAEVRTPDHGRSAFQVGHMNPLKGEPGTITGHSVHNVSWISENGNRIQGYSSKEETHQLILKIAERLRDIEGYKV